MAALYVSTTDAVGCNTHFEAGDGGKMGAAAAAVPASRVAHGPRDSGALVPSTPVAASPMTADGPPSARDPNDGDAVHGALRRMSLCDDDDGGPSPFEASHPGWSAGERAHHFCDVVPEFDLPDMFAADFGETASREAALLARIDETATENAHVHVYHESIIAPGYAISMSVALFEPASHRRAEMGVDLRAVAEPPQHHDGLHAAESGMLPAAFGMTPSGALSPSLGGSSASASAARLSAQRRPERRAIRAMTWTGVAPPSTTPPKLASRAELRRPRAYSREGPATTRLQLENEDEDEDDDDKDDRGAAPGRIVLQGSVVSSDDDDDDESGGHHDDSDDSDSSGSTTPPGSGARSTPTLSGVPVARPRPNHAASRRGRPYARPLGIQTPSPPLAAQSPPQPPLPSLVTASGRPQRTVVALKALQGRSRMVDGDDEGDDEDEDEDDEEDGRDDNDSDDDGSGSGRGGMQTDTKKLSHNEMERRRRSDLRCGFLRLRTVLPVLAGERTPKILVLQEVNDYIQSLTERTAARAAVLNRLRAERDKLLKHLRS